MKHLFRGLIAALLGLAVAGLNLDPNTSPAHAAPQTSNYQVVLATPTLISPANSSTTADSTPTFDWGDVPVADQYQIQIDNNSDFSDPEIDITATSSTYTPASFLTNGTYFWRVRATNVLNDWSDWNTPWTVTIADDNRVDISFNNAWKFFRGAAIAANEVSFNDSSWTQVDLPHTWNNLDGQDGESNYYRGSGWYRKHYTIPSSYAGKRIFIRFEAVSKAANVYVNGTLVGRHEGAFAAFAFDITNNVLIGADNVIAVRADNSSSLDFAPLSGDFNQDGGIFRPVHLLVTDKVHVTPLDYGSPGVYLTPTNVSASSADLQAAVKVDNNSSTQETVSVQTTIRDAGGTDVTTMTSTQTMAAASSATFTQNTTLANPHLWNGRSDPYLYQAVVEVRLGDTVVDQVVQPLGFRYFHLDPNTGFTLNGNPLDLHGVAMHEGRANKGRAISDADRAQDISLIMEMGATFVRLAHYQHAETTYNLTDQNGLIVSTEIPFVNYTSGSTAFADNANRQLRELIRQNYNHPSIFFWGLYNEISTGTANLSLAAALNVVAHAEDATRPTIGANLQAISPSASLPTDIATWNLYYGWYSGTLADVSPAITNLHTYHPYLGVSEYGAGASINQHEQNPPAPTPSGLSHPEEYQNLFHESYWKQMAAMPFLLTKTVWVAFDFAVDSRNEGDAQGRNDKGLITFDRSVKKDAFYWYKANWSDEPVVYITSRRFTPRDNNVVEVKVYSNCDSVELQVAGVSRGSQTSTDHIYRWTNVLLGPGGNTVTALCTRGTEHYQDSVVWDTGPALTPIPVGLYQETDSRIVYTGTWTTFTGTGPNGGSLLMNLQTNAIAKFDFKGTELRLYRTRASNRGSMQVCVDSVCQTVNNNNPTTLWNQMITVASGLANGVHRAVIRNVNTTVLTGYIDLDAVEVVGPPDVPTLISPVDGSAIADGTPDFDWGDSSGATQYQIQVDDNDTFSSPAINAITSISTYTPAVALPNSIYYWRVRASNGLWSDYSGSWTVTVAVPPAVPTLTSPADGSTIVDSTPDFVWGDVAGATQYHIQIADTSDFSNLVLDVDATTSSHTPSVALPNGTYYWRVAASNGVWSDYSGSWTVTVAAPPAAPSGLTAAPISRTRIDLAWVDNSNDETEFKIQRSPAGTAAWSLIATTEAEVTLYSDTTVACSTPYIYRVIATNAAGDSVPSNTAGAATAACLTGIPKAPRITLPAKTLLTKDDTPDFAWTKVTNAATYLIQISANSRFTQIVQGNPVDETAVYTASHLDDGVYYIRVQGVNSLGVRGKWSATRKITIDTTPPLEPRLKKPLDGALTRSIRPTLVVIKSPGAVQYRFQLSSRAGFESTLVNVIKKATSYKVPAGLGLTHDAPYYWRVAAIDQAGNVSGWSTIWSFSITP